MYLQSGFGGPLDPPKNFTIGRRKKISRTLSSLECCTLRCSIRFLGPHRHVGGGYRLVWKNSRHCGRIFHKDFRNLQRGLRIPICESFIGKSSPLGGFIMVVSRSRPSRVVTPPFSSPIASGRRPEKGTIETTGVTSRVCLVVLVDLAKKPPTEAGSFGHGTQGEGARVERSRARCFL